MTVVKIAGERIQHCHHIFKFVGEIHYYKTQVFLSRIAGGRIQPHPYIFKFVCDTKSMNFCDMSNAKSDTTLYFSATVSLLEAVLDDTVGDIPCCILLTTALVGSL